MIVNRGGRCRRDRRRFRTAHRSVLHRSWIRLPGRGFELVVLGTVRPLVEGALHRAQPAVPTKAKPAAKAAGACDASLMVTSEIVAEEVVRTLVGSIGLVASVPVTTYLAALVVSHSGPSSARLPFDDRATVGVGAGHQFHGSGAVQNDLEREPNECNDSEDRPEPRAVRPTLRRRVGDRRQRRRAERTARAEEKQRSWRAPAAEREFWED